MKTKIIEAVDAIGEVEAYKKPHRKGPGPVQARVLPAEDLIHEKKEEIRRGQANRIHFICSNPMCTEPIRADKWETHLIDKTSDSHLQENPEDVLERAQNFAPLPPFDTMEARNQRVLQFMEQRHYLSLARKHDEARSTHDNGAPHRVQGGCRLDK